MCQRVKQLMYFIFAKSTPYRCNFGIVATSQLPLSSPTQYNQSIMTTIFRSRLRLEVKRGRGLDSSRRWNVFLSVIFLFLINDSYIGIRKNTLYNKKHRIRGAILSRLQPLCYLWTHHHCISTIKINLGISCFLQKHLRWRNHPFWLIKVHTFISFESTKSMLSFEMNLDH